MLDEFLQSPNLDRLFVFDDDNGVFSMSFNDPTAGKKLLYATLKSIKSTTKGGNVTLVSVAKEVAHGGQGGTTLDLKSIFEKKESWSQTPFDQTQQFFQYVVDYYSGMHGAKTDTLTA